MVGFYLMVTDEVDNGRSAFLSVVRALVRFRRSVVIKRTFPMER